MKRLSDRDKGLLAIIVDWGRNGVGSADIVSSANLMSAGYATAADELYEGPFLYPTERGIKAARRMKLVEPVLEGDEGGRKWQRTRLGWQLSAMAGDYVPAEYLEEPKAVTGAAP